ncbi:ligand-dependent nuclear receptor-interacting factor 1 isoform X2 [Anolis carolinensis]|uniref:ligand-dependent nuclear receptor-interacting factor 1 isoform X2 n=1 Tax=Anolis carolinensis TaxID=28377 RepID=UPI002F2B441F
MSVTKLPCRKSPRARNIIGHVYHVVSAAGLDGKNLRKFHPVSRTLRNDVPLHQSSVVTDMNRNVSRPGHSNLQDLFANTATSSFVKDTERKKAASGRLILPKLFGQVEMIDASVIKENPTTPITSNIIKDNPTTPTIYSLQSNYCPTDISPLSNEPVMIGSETSNTSYVLMNANRLPLAPKSQVLPSKHPFQIPACEEVKSVPASLLLPSIQQNTLVTSISNTSEACEVKKARTVIYVSPVNTVKTAAFKPLQNAGPKPTTKVPESLPLTVPQITVSGHALLGEAFDSKEKEESPIKWVVQGSPQSSASSCLVPEMSPDNMASQILKTLANIKTTDTNSACIVPAISNNPSVSQAEFTMKDDPVVMFNKKMYLLTKKESSVTVENKHSKVILPSDKIHLGKHQSHLTASPAEKTITNQVVELVLAKHKVVAACNPKDPKICEIIQLPLPSELNKSLKVAYTCSASPHRNLKINNTSQHEATPVLGSMPLQMTVDQKPVPRKNTSQNLTQNIISQRPAASTLFPSTMPGAFNEEEEKIEITPEIQIKHRKVQDRQQYLQLRKKNCLFKVERVCLQRIPKSITSAGLETTVSYSTVQTSDSSDFSQKTSIESQLQEEEKVIEEPEELNMKRKIKTPPICELAKRKKTMVNLGVDQNDSFSAVDNPNSFQPPESPQYNSQASLQFSQEVDLDANPCTEIIEEVSTLSCASDCCENEPSHSEASFREDIFPFSPPDLEDTIRDEKISRLKRLLREQEAALEEISKNMQT